jgi:hypothetical protein
MLKKFIFSEKCRTFAYVNQKCSIMTEQEIIQVNESFNKQLQQQIAGTLPAGHVYHLGVPNDILIEAGLPNLPIEMASRRLVNKAMQENHPFNLNEIMNLVLALNNPLAIFRSATHIGSNVIMTDLKHDNKNFVVAIETNREQNKTTINSIRSIHYRNSHLHIIGWIVEGLCDYFRNDFMESWFKIIENELQSKPQYNSVDVRKQLISAAKIVESFISSK